MAMDRRPDGHGWKRVPKLSPAIEPTPHPLLARCARHTAPVSNERVAAQQDSISPALSFASPYAKSLKLICDLARLDSPSFGPLKGWIAPAATSHIQSHTYMDVGTRMCKSCTHICTEQQVHTCQKAIKQEQ